LVAPVKSFGSNIVLGTRGSELALAQAALVERALLGRWPELNIDMKVIATKGDEAKVVDLRAGRKGLFTSEIERALLSGDVDLAVHSAKDLPSETSPGAEIAAVLARAATDDVLVSKHSRGLAGFRDGATVATGSVRRKHQLLWQRPDLAVVDLRGNVPTRLRKLAENAWDAIVLAHAGLDRLGLSPEKVNFEDQSLFVEILSPEIFLPAGGQGIIALQIRADDKRVRTLVDLVNDHETLLCLRAEREFLRLLQVDCNSPVGVLAKIDNGVMKMRAQFFHDESKVPREGEVEGERGQGERLAAQLLDLIRA
jgi:hydroxymethylbilane synthase